MNVIAMCYVDMTNMEVKHSMDTVTMMHQGHMSKHHAVSTFVEICTVTWLLQRKSLIQAFSHYIRF